MNSQRGQRFYRQPGTSQYVFSVCSTLRIYSRAQTIHMASNKTVGGSPKYSSTMFKYGFTHGIPLHHLYNMASNMVCTLCLILLSKLDKRLPVERFETMYIHMIYAYVCIHIYIYIYREREIYIYTYYIYIYIYLCLSMISIITDGSLWSQQCPNKTKKHNS